LILRHKQPRRDMQEIWCVWRPETRPSIRRPPAASFLIRGMAADARDPCACDRSVPLYLPNIAVFVRADLEMICGSFQKEKGRNDMRTSLLSQSSPDKRKMVKALFSFQKKFYSARYIKSSYIYMEH